MRSAPPFEPPEPLLTTSPRATRQSDPLNDHYRLQETLGLRPAAPNLNREEAGYFHFGADTTCYGRASVAVRSAVGANLVDAWQDVQAGEAILLPFDPVEIVENLRYERYVSSKQQDSFIEASWIKDIYYHVRPMLPVSVRKHIQKAYLRFRQDTTFPRWPVDVSADLFLEKLLVLAMRSSGVDRVPFIWFWPDGHNACAVVTHDVETSAGRDFSARLMDLDDEYGIKAAFQIVPEERYAVATTYLDSIRRRGFELNVHGLNHDGNLFTDRSIFIERARKINHYLEIFGASGFRSPALYRNVDWLQELHCSYDMSIPNNARFEAQRGGCCTVMPYFLPGGMLELPLTTTEDYTLFHILDKFSMALWEEQIGIILKSNGLMCFLIHPDYVQSERAQRSYRSLLERIARLRADERVWVTLPLEVDRWWRERNNLQLVHDGTKLRVKGNGSERARLAYACLDRDRLAYQIET